MRVEARRYGVSIVGSEIIGLVPIDVYKRQIQRISTTEYIFSLKDWIDKLAQRAAVLSLHREKLYDACLLYTSRCV